jgi:hypothetical protein
MSYLNEVLINGCYSVCPITKPENEKIILAYKTLSLKSKIFSRTNEVANEQFNVCLTHLNCLNIGKKLNMVIVTIYWLISEGILIIVITLIPMYPGIPEALD